MRGNRMPEGRVVAAAMLALVLGWAAPAAAQMERSEEIYRQNALGHADAVMRAYRRIEQHILADSTAATDGAAWPGSVPPAATGWLDAWTQRGVRARYCDDTLLVYVEPDRLKGVGADHRAVQVALRLYVPGRGRGRAPTGPGLHWLENGAVTAVGGALVVPLPACLSAPGPLPSGRAAFAGRVRDPFAAANLRQRRTTEVTDPPQACAAGEHGTGRTMFRDVFETLNDRNEVVGAPTFGPWRLLVNGCRADYTVTERFTRECAWQAGPPHNRRMTGIEVWQRTRTVTQAGEVFGPAQFVSTSCWAGDGTGATPVAARVTLVDRQETRSGGCPPGEVGSSTQRRTVTERSAQFPWDASPIETIRETNWVTTSSTCRRPEPVVGEVGETCPPGQTGTPPSCVPVSDPECPAGQTGRWPNCVAVSDQGCPEGYTGTPPNCVPVSDPECPAGQTGRPPNCVPVVEQRCPAGQTGTWPNCVPVSNKGGSNDDDTSRKGSTPLNVVMCFESCWQWTENENGERETEFVSRDEARRRVADDETTGNHNLIVVTELAEGENSEGNRRTLGDGTVDKMVDDYIDRVVDDVMDRLGEDFLQDIADDVADRIGGGA